MHLSVFRAADEYFFVEVEVLAGVVFVEGGEESQVAGVGVGVGKGELDSMMLVLEGELELHLQLAAFSQQQRTFRWDSRPLRPFGGSPFLLQALAEHRVIALGVLGLSGEGCT